MLLAIPEVLTKQQVQAVRARLDAAAWVDGRITAGHQSAQAKNNSQLAETDPVAVETGELILRALGQHPLFRSAALPLKVFPPLFNRYAGGQTFGTHVDNSIRTHAATGGRIRTDLSCTLFFSEPEEYDGGELVVEDTYGSKSVKLPAGDMILYPSTSLHHVTPVLAGCAGVELLLAAKHGPAGMRSGALLFDLDHGHPAHRERGGRGGAPEHGAADRGVPQPAAAVGRVVMRLFRLGADHRIVTVPPLSLITGPRYSNVVGTVTNETEMAMRAAGAVSGWVVVSLALAGVGEWAGPAGATAGGVAGAGSGS